MLRTNYMSRLMMDTYPQVAIKAILHGTIEGAWEKCIAEQLERDYKAGNPDAVELMRTTCNGKTYIEVAYIITASEAPENIGTLKLTPEEENEAMQEIIGGPSRGVSYDRDTFHFH